ncbi:translation initiation factor IF-2 [Dictyobacter sp. S3.2.2.5]|uniref:Translation initiation factor IF-2 n=1 Tax=Dictyobacter halimunensis TaxID=3026934 RepID=A0ABQ6FSV4_9CHLR|nr:translation initiation factor IF-2 [Dictyobacter sp. S3.2.2.5]
METVEQRIQQVCEDREHGSRWLVKEAITILRDLARDERRPASERLRLLASVARQIVQARPAMGALTSAVGHVIQAHEEGLEAMGNAAQQLLDDYASATELMAEHARPYVKGRLMTCSISGTVLEVLVALKDQIEHVTVLEGRPRYEGRAMAQALHEKGIAVTIITDAQADIFLPQCQGVVVGADSLLINGDLLNKAGTALLAWAARGHDIPFYVLSETLKISPKRWHEHDPARMASNLALLEEKEPAEVFADAPSGIQVRNFYFDHTPYRLLTHVITENGLLDRRRIREIAVATRASERLLSKWHP